MNHESTFNLKKCIWRKLLFWLILFFFKWNIFLTIISTYTVVAHHINCNYIHSWDTVSGLLSGPYELPQWECQIALQKLLNSSSSLAVFNKLLGFYLLLTLARPCWNCTTFSQKYQTAINNSKWECLGNFIESSQFLNRSVHNCLSSSFQSH